VIIRIHYWKSNERKQMLRSGTRDDMDRYLFLAKLWCEVVGWEIYESDIDTASFRDVREDIKQSWVIDSWYDRSAFHGKQK
jgi:hypothetical protein